MAERADGRGARGADVLVIGAGLAGLSAAVRAVQAGARVRLIATGWGQQMVAPGWISVCDRADDDVIAEVRGYAALRPDHPYALAGDDAMVHGVDAFCALAKLVNLPYTMRTRDGHNLRLPTMLGAIQTPMIAPQSMANGDLTDLDGELLIVGFEGWRDFEPELMAGNLQARGIAARAIRVTPPHERPVWDLWPDDLARQLDQSELQAGVLEQVRPHVKDAVRVGFPTVLGMDRYVETLQAFESALGRPCFEIPTLPPSIAGVRLSNRLRRWLQRQGARVQVGHPVVRGLVENRRCQGVEVEGLGHTNPFYADHFILATGGLYNGGILSDDAGSLWEPIFDLPVAAPEGEGRAGWYHEHLLVPRGHPIHGHTGLRVDHQMRPLDAGDAPALENVYAVGNLLAGFNPLTDGCAEGIALATAYKAVGVALGLDEKRS